MYDFFRIDLWINFDTNSFCMMRKQHMSNSNSEVKTYFKVGVSQYVRHDCGNYCGTIPRKNYRFRVCAGCSRIRYCSVKCAEENWKFHREECANKSAITSLLNKPYPLLGNQAFEDYQFPTHKICLERGGWSSFFRDWLRSCFDQFWRIWEINYSIMLDR